MSLSKILKVDLILFVIKSLAERITELDGANGIAINLSIVGLFCSLSLSKIRTASIDERLSNLIIAIFAVLFLSKSINRLLILEMLLVRSTIKIEFMEGIADK